jgi:hypothetical protein
MRQLKMAQGLLIVGLALVAVGTAGAAVIRPTGVTGAGTYNNAAGLLIDGSMPAEGTDYNNAQCVYWSGTAPALVIDLGREYQVTGVTAQADNNDDYVFEASADGRAYLPLLVIPANLGRVALGMETFSTDPSNPRYLRELQLTPRRARYIKVSGRGGDGMYAVSEVQLSGEPAGGGPVTPPAPPAPGGPAGPIHPTGVTGAGPFSNAAGLMIDGSMPAEGTDFDNAQCVNWSGTGTTFVIDLGRTYRVTGVTAQVDNNDDYVFEASGDGRAYLPLVVIPANLGRVALGMETFSTDPAHPRYLRELQLTPQRARYIRVSARGGDGAHSVSEVQLMGSAE